jgi:hypothetical protein
MSISISVGLQIVCLDTSKNKHMINKWKGESVSYNRRCQCAPQKWAWYHNAVYNSD